ncbi:conserved Plasmodium protein, unknown function [Plasmodium relictum]|uniref:CERLI1-like PH domain-containing protein n=1 Tax=Plasmodium relictum TaxID=85471 RepID=A0A1J1H1N5_PLARL|nr:conserved Plasmodium protein, unknown function [Plasmodium relictum]CRG98771.1 conserved Plasmodium protein, unknown function [Plasmodium relictum]
MIYIDSHNLFYICSCFLGSVCTLCICKNRDLIPHISENKHIGQIYRFLNIHKYESFSVIIEIHHINLKFSDDEKKKYIIHLKIGNRYAYTHYYKEYQNKIHIEERKNMLVKQNNNVLRIEVYKKGTLKNTFFGSSDIHIYNDIIKKLFPNNIYFNLVNKNQIVANISLSFHYINLNCIKKDDQIYTSLFIETIISVQKSQNKNNKKIEELINEGKEHFEAIKETDVSLNIYKNISSLAIEDKIHLFCKNLNGYLLYSNYYVKRYYYKYYFYLHFFKGKFYWCYYNDETDALVDNNRIDYIRLEYVVNVYSDVYNHKYFYIKYKKKNEKKENYLYLKTVDKDRNIWINVIHDFIILINNYKNEKKSKKKKLKEKNKQDKKRTSREIEDNNNSLSHSLSMNSIKNKYLDKKYKVDTLSNIDNEDDYKSHVDLRSIYKDMNKNMYNYSD